MILRKKQGTVNSLVAWWEVRNVFPDDFTSQFSSATPWKLGPSGKHSSLSSQGYVVSWSRGSLQIKPSGSGDKNGISSSPVIARAGYWTQKHTFFRANSAKKGIVSGLQQSSCYANLYTALDLKTKCFIYRQTKKIIELLKIVCRRLIWL